MSHPNDPHEDKGPYMLAHAAFHSAVTEETSKMLDDAMREFDKAFYAKTLSPDLPTPAPPAQDLAPRSYRTAEQNEVLGTFLDLLAGPTGDGGTKRATGDKPSWKVDDHLHRGLGHLYRYLYEGERADADSGCHPLTHAAWRFLAVAWQDIHASDLLPEEPE